MSICTFSGLMSLLGGVPTGSSRFTACSWIGMVMISITSNTSITSISGVVLMSIIGSGSGCDARMPRARDFLDLYIAIPPSAAQRRRFGDERHLGDARALARIQHLADAVVLAILVAADVDFRLRLHGGHLLQARDEVLDVVHARVVPVDVAGRIDRDHDVLGLGLPDL